MRTANLFFSLLALATNLALVAVLVSAALPRLRAVAQRHAAAALPLAAVVATVSMLGSLYYSEIVGFRPCRLCWFQRGAMYPLAIILIIALVMRRPGVWRIGVGVAVVGALLSSYHYLIQHVPSLAFESTCSLDAPCTAAEIWQFGFISLAYMAGSAFLLIAALLWFGTRRAPAPNPPSGLREGASVAVATLAVAGIVAALAAPFGTVTPVEPQPTAVAGIQVVGDDLPRQGDEQSDPAVGAALPEMRGDNYDGEPVAITNDGRPKIVMVVAHWCPHCQAEVPDVQAWLDDNGMPTDVDLYSISTAADAKAPNFPPDEWLEREGWSVPVIADDEDQRAATAVGINGYPFFVFVGADGLVRGRHSGELKTEDLAEFVEMLASEQ